MLASLDTGASHCLFARVYAEGLGLPFESGQRLTFATANSRFDAFGHELTIDVLGIEITALVFFFADPNITKNVLGRAGWTAFAWGWSTMIGNCTSPAMMQAFETNRRAAA